MDLTYDLVHEEGEPHNKTFTMAAIINGENYGTGSGGSKKRSRAECSQDGSY
nr:double-stranded RNA binding motif domain-containing protein [Methanobacterium formicicum]